MPAAYNGDLRKRVIAFLRFHGNKIQATRQFGVSYSTVCRWERQLLNTGKLTAKPQGRKPGVSKIDAQELESYVSENPDSTLAEIGQHFGVSGVMIWKRLRQIESSFQTRAAANRAFNAELATLRAWFEKKILKTALMLERDS